MGRDRERFIFEVSERVTYATNSNLERRYFVLDWAQRFRHNQGNGCFSDVTLLIVACQCSGRLGLVAVTKA